MLIPSHLIYVLKREISSVPQLHKTSPCFSSQLGLCCLPDTWQKVHATQLLPVCHKIWKTRESHCPATILPTIAWPRSAFAAEYCPDRSSPLNKKKKKRNWLQIASCQVIYQKWNYPTSMLECSSADFLPSVPNQQCSWCRNSARSRREPWAAEQVEVPKQMGV